MLPLAHLLCKLFVLLAHLECGRLPARAHVHVHIHVGGGGCPGLVKNPTLFLFEEFVRCSMRNGRGCVTARRRDGERKETMQVSEYNLVWWHTMTWRAARTILSWMLVLT